MRQTILVFTTLLLTSLPAIAQSASPSAKADLPQTKAVAPSAAAPRTPGSPSSSAPSHRNATPPPSRRSAATPAPSHRNTAPTPPRTAAGPWGLSLAEVEKLMGRAVALTRSDTPEQGWAEVQKLNVKYPGITVRFERALQDKLKQTPTDGDALYALGTIQTVSANYVQAAKTFANLTTLRGNDHYALAFQGFALLEAGSPVSATKPLQAALSLRPNFRYARFLLAQAYYRRGDRQQALKLMMPKPKATPRAAHT